MDMVACQCGGLPAHDHLMGHRLDENNVYGPWWDMDDVGRVWVDWEAVARALAAGDRLPEPG